MRFNLSCLVILRAFGTVFHKNLSSNAPYVVITYLKPTFKIVLQWLSSRTNFLVQLRIHAGITDTLNLMTLVELIQGVVGLEFVMNLCSFGKGWQRSSSRSSKSVDLLFIQHGCHLPFFILINYNSPIKMSRAYFVA